jgi:prevent-host-death family protein
MRQVGIKDLKNNLSIHVRAAEAGETVLITDRGKVIAQLVPAPKPNDKPKREKTQEEILDELEREGRLVQRGNRGGPPPQPIPIPGYTLKELLQDLDEFRADRWPEQPWPPKK